jgi:hypothetical protein
MKPWMMAFLIPLLTVVVVVVVSLVVLQIWGPR